MNMEEFLALPDEKRPKREGTGDPNSIRNRVFASIPKQDAIAERDILSQFPEIDAKKIRKTLNGLAVKRGRAKKPKINKAFNELEKEYYYSRLVE